MEKSMENEMEALGSFKGYIGIYRDVTPIMENQLEWKLGISEGPKP